MRSHHDIPIRRHEDVPLRRLGDVPLRRRWVFHFRRTCDVTGTNRETSLRCRHDVLLPGKTLPTWEKFLNMANKVEPFQRGILQNSKFSIEKLTWSREVSHILINEKNKKIHVKKFKGIGNLRLLLLLSQFIIFKFLLYYYCYRGY